MLGTMKLSSIALVLVLGFFVSIKAQVNIQRKQLFDDDWKFYLGDVPEANTRDFKDQTWRILNLPHDWSIEGKLDPKNTTGGGGYFPSGIGWYRKSINVSPSWKNKRVSIYFEGVYMNSEVFINGKSLGIHPYGYTPFYYDLSPFLDYNKENLIAVRVDNSKQPNCRWYSGSGIYRHVWIIVTDPIHIGNWGVGITTPLVSSEKATVTIKTVIKNETDLPQDIIISTQLTDKKMKSVGDNIIKVELQENSEKEIEQMITVSNPLLWTPETPNLYQAKIKLMKDKKTIDDLKTTFGIRAIKFSVENGFELNGKTVKINGGCLHHDNGCLGAAAFDRAEERRVELIKLAGFNAIRTSHNPPSEAFLNACDKLGMLVIDESFDGWKESKTPYDYSRIFDEWWKHDLEAMVKRDRNHPSIIMWSTGNEIIERKKPDAVETANMLANYIRKIDPTRPVISAMTTWDKEWEMFDSLFAAHDIGGYNYQIHRAQTDHERVPSRIMIQTESYPRDAFSNWKMVQSFNYIIGDFVWTAIDYLGESGIGRYYYPGETKGEHWEGEFYPWHGAYCGDIDLIGWRKPISHYRNILWNQSEKLYMAVREPNPDNGKITETLWSVWPTWESWTWPDHEGKDLQVEVYSKYPKVRLYLNDKLIGEQATTEEQQYKTTFNVSYTPGLLKAVGVVDNKEVETTILQTSGDAAKVKLIPDRTKISADSQDLSFITIEVIDKKGTLKPNAQNQLQFEISGPGVIVGVDNANLKDLDQYVGATRKTWNGRALVVIRSTNTEGNIKLKVSSPGLKDAVVLIKSEKKN
jgi:beta-galactosidase